jgi:glycine dehydrogenase subunit 1
LAERLTSITHVELATPTFFNEFTLKLPRPAAEVADALADRGIIAGVRASRLYPHQSELRNHLIIAVTETNTDADIEAYGRALAEVLA